MSPGLSRLRPQAFASLDELKRLIPLIKHVSLRSIQSKTRLMCSPRAVFFACPIREFLICMYSIKFSIVQSKKKRSLKSHWLALVFKLVCLCPPLLLIFCSFARVKSPCFVQSKVEGDHSGYNIGTEAVLATLRADRTTSLFPAFHFFLMNSLGLLRMPRLQQSK